MLRSLELSALRPGLQRWGLEKGYSKDGSFLRGEASMKIPTLEGSGLVST